MRSNESQPIQDVFAQINDRINEVLASNPECIDDVAWQKKNIPYIGELFLGHVRYGTFGKNSIESVHPFLRQNNWMHRNLILAGNFNMTNVDELFDKLVNLAEATSVTASTLSQSDLSTLGFKLNSAWSSATNSSPSANGFASKIAAYDDHGASIRSWAQIQTLIDQSSVF